MTKSNRFPNRCHHVASPLGQPQQCQRPRNHEGEHDYGNAAIRTQPRAKPEQPMTDKITLELYDNGKLRAELVLPPDFLKPGQTAKFDVATGTFSYSPETVKMSVLHSADEPA